MTFKYIHETLQGIFAYNEYENSVLAHDGDSNLIKKFSKVLTLESGAEVRTAIIPHQQERMLGREIVEVLPLVFFVHGLGGQLNQFEYLLDIFSYFANVVAIDLPGHGKSPYIDDWETYSTDSFVKICKEVLSREEIPKHQKVFLVGHSMGSICCCRLAPLIDCVGIAAITPPYKAPKEAQELAKKKKILYYVPPFLFDVFRAAVRVGGNESASVKNMVAASTLDDTILSRQLRTNLQSQTKTWLRTAYGVEFLTPEQLAEIEVPVIGVGAACDKVVRCEAVEEFIGALSTNIKRYEQINNAGHAVPIEKPQILAGLINEFIRLNVDSRLDLGWQLQEIAKKSDKWSVKNEKKWKGTLSVGEVVQGSKLRGMKTLRQQDDEHSPNSIGKIHPDIVAIIDISREAPSYDPETLPCKYHKYPTVAKIPPTLEEVKGFVKLVNEVECGPGQSIGVHCHYGFNRTGFFICSYLLEMNICSVSEALDRYEASRPTGIHHVHFIDELHLRYEH